MRRAARTAFMSPAERGTSALVSRMLADNDIKVCQHGFPALVMEPGDGVSPPQLSPEHSSTRAAPAVWAQTADDRESTQNSTAMPALGAGPTMPYADTV